MNEKINRLKELALKSDVTELDKTIFKIYHVYDDNDIEFGCIINYIKDINKYEVYCFVRNNEDIASCLGLFFTSKNDEAIQKFENYKKLVNQKNIKSLETLL